MPFDVKWIDRIQANKVIDLEEGQYGDVKALEKKPSSLSEDVSAFANPPNRDVGEGIKTATAAMTALGLEPPIFKEMENSFLVTIKHEKLATAELTIMDYLESHETINNKQARKITFIHEDWRVKSIFRGMEEKKMIKQVDGTKTSATKYRKRNHADDTEENAEPFTLSPT